MTTIDQSMNEFRETFGRGGFGDSDIFWKVSSFLRTALEQYGKQEYERAKEDGVPSYGELKQLEAETRAQAIRETREADIAAVEKYLCEYESVEGLINFRINHRNIKELARRAADTRQNVVIKEILAVLKSLNEERQ